MATVRDPGFWRRFSMAVHLDEEAQAASTTTAPKSRGRSSPKHSDLWLDRQKAKQSRRTLICWLFWLCIFALTAGIVLLVLWLQASGILGGGDKKQST